MASWWKQPLHQKDPIVRVFCFPHAGGHSSFYYKWAQCFSKHYEWFILELPGHGSRITEPLIEDFRELENQTLTHIIPLLDRPFAFFGHSLGGLLAHRVLSRIEQKHGLDALNLILSSSPGPQRLQSPDYPKRAHLPDDELTVHLIELGGLPQELVQHMDRAEYKELWDMMLPVCRADYRVLESMPLHDFPTLRSPISTLWGKDDRELPEGMDEWKDLTYSYFEKNEYPGDHFYFLDKERTVVHVIERLIRARSYDRRISLG